MNENEFKEISEKAKAFAKVRGFSQQECEDFAQDYIIGYLQDRTAKLEEFFAEHRRRLRTSEGLAGVSAIKLSAFRTVSLDAPIDRTDSDSAKFGDVIGVFRDDLEHRTELEFYLDLLDEIFALATDRDAREWAERVFKSKIESAG